MIKWSIQQEDKTFINIYVPNTGASKYIKPILTKLKGKIYSSSILVGECNTPLTSIDRQSRLKLITINLK